MHRHRQCSQSGMALLAGLLILAAISLLALAATVSMVLQQAMAGNFTDQQLADQAAREALRRGEQFLFGLESSSRRADCLQNCFDAPLNGLIHAPITSPVFPELESAQWWLAWAVDSNLDPLTSTTIDLPWTQGSEPPRYLLEELFFESSPVVDPGAGAPDIAGVAYYRVLGRGVGWGAAAVTVEEAIIARPWINDGEGESQPQVENSCAAFVPWYDCGLLTRRQRR